VKASKRRTFPSRPANAGTNSSCCDCERGIQVSGICYEMCLSFRTFGS
jgi:hypothetical protein